MGATSSRIVFREIFAQPVTLVAVTFGLITVAGVIVIEGSLAFLGLSVALPTPSWGYLIAEGTSNGNLSTNPYIMLWPVLAMFLLLLSINLIGDRMRQRFDIREGLPGGTGAGDAPTRRGGEPGDRPPEQQAVRLTLEFPDAVPAEGPCSLAFHDRPAHLVPHRPGHRSGGWTSGVSLTVGRGRTLGVVGESGSGKTAPSRSTTGRPPPRDVIGSNRHRPFLRSRSYRPLDARSSCGRCGGAGFQHDLPGSDYGPQPGLADRQADHRDVAAPSRHEPVGGQRPPAVESSSASVGIPLPRAAHQVVPVPAVGRHAPAGADRDRLRLQAEADHGRRADHRGWTSRCSARCCGLLRNLQRERHMAVILVTHDLGVVASRADDIIVMYAGRIVERAPTRTLFTDTKMPYTRALMDSIPRLADPSGARLDAIGGRPPDLINPPTGCRFAPRCPYAQDKCRETEPPLRTVGSDGPPLRLLVPPGGRGVDRPAGARVTVDGDGDGPAPARPGSRRP